MHRKHRTGFEQLFSTDVFRCTQCRTTVKYGRLRLALEESFVLSRYTRCAACGSARVSRTSRRHSLPLVSHHILSLLLRLSGAPSYICEWCSHQYFDWRGQAPQTAPGTPPVVSTLYSRSATRSS